jgi:hypothetical protein
MVNHGHQPKPSTVPGGYISHHGDESSLVQLVGRQFYFEDFPVTQRSIPLGNTTQYPFCGILVLDFESGDIIQLAAKAIIEEYT